MRIVFMGTPQFAVPSLNALHEAGHELALVVTQPDRPQGRRAVLTPPPVKQRALELGIPVFQPERIRRKEAREYIQGFSADLFVTAAFGQILSQRVLDIPRLGTVNVHASLLPKYRGSAPINWCLINGETTTGVTTMLTDAGIDTGAMLLKKETPIAPCEDAEALAARLSQMGATLLVETLRAMEQGSLVPCPQNEEEMSYYPMLTKQMGQIDFSLDASQVVNQVRGLAPWPGTYIATKGGAIKVYKAKVASMQGEAGEVLLSSPKEGLVIACGKDAVEICEMQAPGGKRMGAKDYLRGKSIQAHSKIEERI